MTGRWTKEEEYQKREELINLYLKKNKSIGEIGKILGIAKSTVFDRMVRLNIPSIPEKKIHYRNKRNDIVIPRLLSPELAEFVGIMLGDGHLSNNQIWLTVHRKEEEYLKYLIGLTENLFKISPRYIDYQHKNVYDIYIGSVDLVNFLKRMGLVSNKVREQVGVPAWIYSDSEYCKCFLRGFFDTDGSVYALKFGFQMCFCNRSKPLLQSLRNILLTLSYHPSKISNYNLYLTRKSDLVRYIKEIGFNNPKHLQRIKKLGVIKMGA